MLYKKKFYKKIIIKKDYKNSVIKKITDPVEGPFPVHYRLCGWCQPDLLFNRESLIYPL